MDAGTIRVYAPSPAIFLCGGPVNASASTPPSLRDAFLRLQTKAPFSEYKILLAEDLNAFFPRGSYQDILSFESDIAQLSELIILFSESFGSAAEMGAFSMVPEIALRLLIVIDDKHYSIQSFITLGPIRYLENEYKGSSVCVINLADLSIRSISDLSTLNTNSFSGILGNAIEARRKLKIERTTFDSSRNGHLIKLIVGLIQHYGSLTEEEIEVLLYCFEISIKNFRIPDFLLCAEFLGWIIKDKRGINTFYSARAAKEAVQYKHKLSGPVVDRVRWRADVVEYWRQDDPERFSSITFARRSTQ